MDYSTEEYKGYTIKVEYDQDPCNPRTEWDSAGTMVCWHSRYNLGDMEDRFPISKNYQEPIDLLYELAGVDRQEIIKKNYYNQILEEFKSSKYYEKDVEDDNLVTDEEYLQIIAETETGSDHSDWEKENWQYQIGKFMSKVPYWNTCQERELDKADLYKLIEDKGTIIKKLFLYDHSGITISTSPFSCRWDSGQIGWIYITKEKIEAEGWTPEQANNYLDGEVEVYDNYLTGEVYGFTIEDADGEEVESCWGYYGNDGKESMIKECKHTIDYLVKKQEERNLLLGIQMELAL